MNMNKIIILSLLGDPMIPATSRDSRAGGFNTDVKQWLVALGKTNYPIAVITNTSIYSQSKIQKISENITLYRVHLDENSFKNASALMEQYSYVYNTIKQLLRHEKINPVFIHSYFWYSGYLAMELSDLYQIPFIHTIIDLSAYKKRTHVSSDYSIQEICEHKIFAKASCIMAITEEEKRIFLEYYNVPEERIIVVGREVDPNFLHLDHTPSGLADDFCNTLQTSKKIEKTIKNTFTLNSKWWNQGAFLYMGRIKEIKGIPVIVKSWHQLYQYYKEATPPLWIAGGTPNAILDMRNLIKKDIPELEHLEESLKICWWGYLSPKSLSALFLKTSVLIAHSRYEAGGLVVLEAMSSGIPVIATQVGFAKDCIQNWKNGFLVPYQDINALSRRMEHFIQQPLLSQSLGNYARKTYYYYINKWNFFEKNLIIYEKYWNNMEGKLGDIENPKRFPVSTKKSDFERGIINTYPYLLFNLDKNSIIDICSNRISVKKVISSKKMSNHSNIWKIYSDNGNYIVKNIYTLINKHKLWNSALINETFSCYNRMQKLLFSAESSYTIDFLKYDIEKCYCIMKEYPIFHFFNSPTEMFCTMQLLKNFSDNMTCLMATKEKLDLSCEFYKCNPVTPNNVFQEIINSSSMLHSDFLSEMQQFITVLTSYFNTNYDEQDSFELMVQYGKKVFGHIVHIDTEYKLLPSDSIFEGTPGYDVANLLNDFWLYKKIEDERTIYADVMASSNLLNISVDTIVLWGILILMTQIKQNMILSLTIDNKATKCLLNILVNILVK